MVKFVALYPGQGSQERGMALDFYQVSPQVRELFERFSQGAQIDLKKVIETGNPAILGETLTTQLVVTLANLSALTVARELEIPIASHAGFSLGELSGYYASEVLEIGDLLKLLLTRGTLLRRHTQALERGGRQLAMAAVIGLSFERAQQILDSSGVKGLFCANDNSPQQVVLSGYEDELAQVVTSLKKGGAQRVIKLKVRGAFHTPLMGEAQKEFAQFLEGISFNHPIAKLYSSVSAQEVASGEEARGLLARQFSSPVRWRSLMEKIKGNKALELGPGRVLTRLSGEGCYLGGSYAELVKVKEGVGDV
jgi:[acyl-carrier-protein] S-malonyltransferase